MMLQMPLPLRPTPARRGRQRSMILGAPSSQLSTILEQPAPSRRDFSRVDRRLHMPPEGATSCSELLAVPRSTRSI